MEYLYIRSEPGLWTVGYESATGKWMPESDHSTREEAASRVSYLNGDNQELIKTLNAEIKRLRDQVDTLERALSVSDQHVADIVLANS